MVCSRNFLSQLFGWISIKLRSVIIFFLFEHGNITIEGELTTFQSETLISASGNLHLDSEINVNNNFKIRVDHDCVNDGTLYLTENGNFVSEF